MTKWHLKSKRKPSGGRRRTARRSDKKLSWKGSTPVLTHVAEKEERKKVKGKGGSYKVKLKKAKTVSVTDLKEKKTFKAEISSVLENTSNRQFVRRNIVSKGAIIEVVIGSEKKKAKVTSRPGQNGVIQAVLI